MEERRSGSPLNFARRKVMDHVTPTNGTKQSVNRLWWVLALVATLGVPACTVGVGVLVGQQVEFGKRVAVIEANRFTSRDWATESNLLRKELTYIRENMAMRSDLEKLPPTWLVEELRETKKRVAALERR